MCMVINSEDVYHWYRDGQFCPMTIVKMKCQLKSTVLITDYSDCGQNMDRE